MSAVAAPAPPLHVGRFRLREVLGQGAQATVWLAHDERLDRDVALKLMAPGAAAVALEPWLHEARAVSRLTHPHIVPVFEADETQGQAYLVFELVRGPTLSQALREHGAMPPRQAVTLMVGVLDALATAHTQGIVHRDLKPSNILLDDAGRARVMDFGIAARTGAPREPGRTEDAWTIVGTPGYMSPEAAAGAAPAPAMDVFAAGLVLVQMLSGTPLLRERDPMRALERVRNEDLVVPEITGVDAQLRALLQQTLQRNPAQRLASASGFRDALAQWLTAGGPAAEGASAAGSGTLDFLLRRMRHRSDFPALSDAMARIQRLTASDTESLSRLSDEILKDVALTNKLLRMVNSAHFRHAGGGSISTVSRAVALVGFGAIRNLAMSLLLLEHMQDKAHALRLREQFLHALFAAQLAHGLSQRSRDGEESYLGALMRHLGRLLTEFYFPEEAQTIRDLQRPRPGQPPCSPAQAAQQVLGIGFDALGQGVAKAWGLPENLRGCMIDALDEPPHSLQPSGPTRLRWLAALCHEAADAVLASEADALPERLGALSARYARALGLGGTDLQQAVAQTRVQLGEMAQALGLTLAKGSSARRLLGEGTADLGAGPAAAASDRPPGQAPRAGSVAPTRPTEQVVAQLSAGIQDITDTLAGDSFRLEQVLRMVLETMWRALDFRRVVFCLRDARSDTLIGRFGLGSEAQAVAKRFRVQLGGATGQAPDLFATACRKGADMLISDAPRMAERLPGWFRAEVDAPSFLLLPLLMKGAPLALIYADKGEAGGIVLEDKEMALLRTLRNQAVMAFKQAA
ncbi:HDOD domain-containing protein,protein kinase family protein [Burkholderiales bacterium JOSHI_001]|nr:HDOD domain-containing protein,protein kinase family protein [Burkholderiales bacterium JOSHI_001]